MADSRSPDSPTPAGPRPGVRPFVRPGTAPRPALSRPTITPSRLTRPPFRAVASPPARQAAAAPPTDAPADTPAPRPAIETVEPTPQVVLEHVAGGAFSTAEIESAEIAMLGGDVGEGLTLTTTDASEVLFAEAHGQREDSVRETLSAPQATSEGEPGEAAAVADVAEGANVAEVAPVTGAVECPDAVECEVRSDEPRETATVPMTEDPFLVASRAPVAESDWWSFHGDTPVLPARAGDDDKGRDLIIGGSPHVVHVAVALEVLANRVRAGEIAVDAIPLDAGDAAMLAGLLTSLLTRSSA